MVQQGSHSYILCTLHAPNYLQQTLDLEINKGESITFSLNSNGKEKFSKIIFLKFIFCTNRCCTFNRLLYTRRTNG
jgi:hypothetical protein